MLGGLSSAEGNSRRPQQIVCAPNAIHDAAGDETLIFIHGFADNGSVLPAGAARRMRVRRRDEHIVLGNMEILLNERARLIAHETVDAEKITDYKHELRLAIV